MGKFPSETFFDGCLLAQPAVFQLLVSWLQALRDQAAEATGGTGPFLRIDGKTARLIPIIKRSGRVALGDGVGQRVWLVRAGRVFLELERKSRRFPIVCGCGIKARSYDRSDGTAEAIAGLKLSMACTMFWL